MKTLHVCFHDLRIGIVDRVSSAFVIIEYMEDRIINDKSD